jgi:hypothetical protein
MAFTTFAQAAPLQLAAVPSLTCPEVNPWIKTSLFLGSNTSLAPANVSRELKKLISALLIAMAILILDSTGP